MNIEDELRGALDVSAPPPTTTLDTVMKRGRRRVLTQRIGAVAGAAAVVAVVGLVAATLPAVTSSSPAGPATLPTSPPRSNQNGWVTGWPEIGAPLRTPDSNWTPTDPPPGWEIMAKSQCTPKPRSTPLTVPFGAIEFAADKTITLTAETVKEFPALKLTGASRYEGNYQLIGLGEGSLTITLGKFAGTPMTAASDGLWDTTACHSGFRTTLSDGTVMELRPLTVSDNARLGQMMLIYRADGKLIMLEQNNFGPGSALMNSGAHVGWSSFGPFQPRLPMTQEQFEKLGPAFAEVE